jgi:formylglycine-generating enzyme required for sulfatase activity
VDELISALRGYTCWRDTTAIAGGQMWREEIIRAIEAAYAMILVVSTDTEQSKEVYAEYFYAFGHKVPVIPLILDDCDLPFGLENINARLWYEDQQRALQGLRSDLDFYRSTAAPLKPASDIETYLAALKMGELLGAVANYTPMAGEGRFRTERALPVPRPVVMQSEFTWRRSGSLTRDRRREVQRRNYKDLLPALHKSKRVMVLGEPGIGKTSTLYKFADELAYRALDSDHAPIPLIVPLREWRGEVTWDALIDQHLGVLAPRYKQLLAGGRLYFLLDGLNELPRDDRRGAKLDALQSLLDAKTPVVVTCRELDYRDEALNLDLDTITIHPLDPERVRDFLCRYLNDASGKTNGAAAAENLFWQIAGGADVKAVWEKWHQAGKTLTLFFRSPEIPEDVYKATSGPDDWTWWEVVKSPGNLMRLAANPYMLWMLLHVYLDGETIPSNRGALFDEFVFQLLKREGFSDGEKLIAAGRALTDKLEELGWIMQRRAVESGETSGGVELTVARNEAITILGGDEQLYRAACANIVEDSDHVRFVHQLLQEYFVGRRMLVEIKAGRFNARDFWPKDHWWQPSGWEEATVLAVGMSAVQAQREILEQLTLANPEVAAHALTRSGIQFDDSLKMMLREILVPQLVDLDQHPQAGARAAIGRALGRVAFTNGEFLDSRAGIGLTSEGFPDIDWVDIPGGTIILEDVDGEFHVNPFRIARYLMTNRQFQAFVHASDGYGQGKWWKNIEQSSAPSTPEWAEANHPRETVSWYEAVAFCRWLTEKYLERGLLKKGQAICLPTEWEWQQAATNGNNYNVYPWGLTWDSTRCNSANPARRGTSAVGIYPHGTWPGGPLDMAGNVWEWCLNKYKTPKSREAIKITKSGQRVMRGGSWDDIPEFLRSSHRIRGHSHGRLPNTGFRLAQVFN